MGLITLAQWVLTSSALPLPRNFDDEMSSISERHDLVTCYELMAYLQGFRNLIARWSQPTRKGISVPGPGVGRLLNRWPLGFESTVIRLLRFQHRHHTGTLVLVWPNSNTAQLLGYLDEAHNNHLLGSEMREMAVRLACQFVAPLARRSQAIFNPAIPVDVSWRHLKIFSDWWCDLSKMIERIEGMEQSDTEFVRSSLIQFDEHRDRSVIIMLSTLISAAIKGWPVRCFLQLARVWPPTRDVTNLQPLALLEYLGQQLQNISDSHLYYLVELAASSGIKGSA